MNKKKTVKLTEGSKYRILSISGRDSTLQSEGVFKGYATMGIDEGGLILELGENHGDMQGKTRIVPLHAVLAIDILDEKEHEGKDDIKDADHSYW